MPYTIDWYIENEILYSHFTGKLTADDLQECLTKMIALIDSSPRSLVHSISDAGNLDASPSLQESVRVIRQSGSHPRAGWSISVGEKSLLVKMAGAMGASLFKMRSRNFATLDQAIDYLKEIDKTIHWDQINESLLTKLARHFPE